MEMILSASAHHYTVRVAPRPSGPGPYKLATVFLAVLSAVLFICIIAVAAHNKKVTQGAAEEPQIQKQTQEVNVTALLATLAQMQQEKTELHRKQSELQEKLDQLLIKRPAHPSPTNAPLVPRIVKKVQDVPAGSVASPTVCPQDWHLFNSSCYYISDDSDDWDLSQSFCQGEGAHLAIVTTVEEQTFLWDLLPREHWNGFWIGVTDGHTEDEWKWVDGTRLVSSFWEDGEPNNHLDEDCVYIVKTLKHERVAVKSWYDSPCHLSWRFICEKELEPAGIPTTPN
ncbi:C-type lectin domain family 4 member E-like [Lampris incognitus]|uniref:C-type lectin domain family 4 member E-like n=1 Tax=Lampris incognitus TaxID=2546036 RepID=UPI0024B54E89|nr:C-type lectin domain family 4 member E-like [Lampris incognitus]